MTQTAVRPQPQAAGTAGKTRGRNQRIRTQILEYLARNGASRVSDISNEVAACRDTIRTHLVALENAAIVRSNIPTATRARATPFYSLTPQTTLRGMEREEPMSELTVRIKHVNDGQLTLVIDELPDLVAFAPGFSHIPEAAQAAAAQWTGRPAQDFRVRVLFI